MEEILAYTIPIFLLENACKEIRTKLWKAVVDLNIFNL